MASGLSAAYFGAYFLCPLTISGWILRHYGFRVTFMTGEFVLRHEEIKNREVLTEV